MEVRLTVSEADAEGEGESANFDAPGSAARSGRPKQRGAGRKSARVRVVRRFCARATRGFLRNCVFLRTAPKSARKLGGKKGEIGRSLSPQDAPTRRHTGRRSRAEPARGRTGPEGHFPGPQGRPAGPARAAKPLGASGLGATAGGQDGALEQARGAPRDGARGSDRRDSPGEAGPAGPVPRSRGG